MDNHIILDKKKMENRLLLFILFDYIYKKDGHKYYYYFK
jgi:hypothetical protein